MIDHFEARCTLDMILSVCQVLYHHVSCSPVLFRSANFCSYSRNRISPVHFDLLSTLLVASPWFPGCQALRVSPYPSYIWKFTRQLSTQIRYCSEDTELIDGNKCTKNHFDGFVAAIEMYGQFPFHFKSTLSKALDPRKTGCPLSLKLIIIISATLSRSTFGLYM